jgi:zinc protease
LTDIDWKKGPGYKPTERIVIPKFETTILDNGTKMIEINQGTQDIIKLDIVFRGGRMIEQKKLVARFTALLLREGTQSYTSSEIANKLDYYGAVMRIANNLDHTYLSLTCLTKYFDEILPIIWEIIYQPTFPQSELDKAKKTTKERLILDLAKNDMVSYRLFTEALFGSNHPYGYNTEINDIELLTRQDLLTYYQEAFGSDNCYIVLAGKFPQTIADRVKETFGKIIKNSKSYSYSTQTQNAIPGKITFPTKNELQASVKIGRRMFDRHHEDYGFLYVLTTILGGYFGSRLMTSIREDLGYTYNIYAALDFMIHDGYFYIATEVGREYLHDTIEEIKNNLSLLQNKNVGRLELDMVKSYLKGNMLNLLDGPLNSSNTIRSLELDYCLDDQFNHFLDAIDNVKPKKLREIANQYLNWEDMTVVIVGEV